MYYLQSRYYDPEVGRFVNVDDCSLLEFSHSILSNNLNSYCSNNIVNKTDSSGYASFSDLWAVIKDSFEIIKSIADQVYEATKKKLSTKQIKKYAKASQKSQRQIVREFNKTVKESEKIAKRLKKLGRIVTVIALIILAIEVVREGGWIPSTIFIMIVTFFIEGLSMLISWLVEKGCLYFFPSVGFLVGFMATWILGKIISSIFNSARIQKYAKAYESYTKNSVIDWFMGLIFCMPHAFI